MLRLLKYLKPYWLLVVLDIALLFGQAMADLALPGYMSQIVNVGIQQGGIDSAVPQAILQSDMEKLFLFMGDAEQAIVLASYNLIDQSSPDFDQYLETYPALANEPVYVLKELDRDQMEALNSIMQKPQITVFFIEQIESDPAGAAQMGKQLGFDLSQIPAGTDIFAMLARLPGDQMSLVKAGIEQQLANMQDTLITAASVGAVRAEYQALGMDLVKIQTQYILQVGIVMLLVTLLSGACAIGVGYVSARAAAGMSMDIRHDLFERVESFSSVEFDKFSTASLITRTTNDITQVQMVTIMVLRIVFFAPIIAVGGIIRAMGTATSMWWIIALTVMVLLGMIVIVFSIALPKFRIIQKLIDRLNLVTRESLSGMMVIRAFHMQSFEEKRFDKANQDLTSTMLFINRVMVVMMPLMMLMMNAAMLLIIWVGAHASLTPADAGRRHDGLHAVHHADRLRLPDAFDDVHRPATGGRLRRPHRRCARHRAVD